MKIGYYAAALGTMLPEQQLEVVANNLANVETPGYKSDRVYFKDFMSEASYTRMDQGRLKQTGSPFDVALEGEGLFKVQKDGKTLYTRNGNLKLDESQHLVTQEGWQVLGESGPIQLTGSNDGIDPRIEQDGQIFDGKDQAATLAVVKFAPTDRLRKTIHGYFEPENPNAAPSPVSNAQVQQMFLEGANFEVPEEMASMIEALRGVESFQKVMRAYQDIDSDMIRKLGSI